MNSVYNELTMVEVESVEPVTTSTVTKAKVIETKHEVEKPIDAKINRIVFFGLNFIEAILALRFIFKMLGANTNIPFTQILYGLSGALVFPFEGIFTDSRSGPYEFEPGTIIAMIIYLLIAFGLAKLVTILSQTASE